MFVEAALVFLLARPTTLELPPHGCNLSEILRPTLGSLLPADFPSTPYDEAIWDGLVAMWAFEHIRSLGKGLLSCQQRILVHCDRFTAHHANLFSYALPFCLTRDPKSLFRKQVIYYASRVGLEY